MRRPRGESVMARGAILGIAAGMAFLTGCASEPEGSWGAMRAQTLSQFVKARNALRLYDGAPPVISHQVAGLGRENCLNCHAPGAYDNAERVASPRSHPAWGDCRQCHVERDIAEVFRQTNFEPLRYRAKGRRPTAISPPMIPHQLQNREDCALCHIGEQAHPAIRAQHGYRSQCRQCHVAMFP